MLVQMAGEFATFTEPTRRPNSYPAYRHEDLQRSFAPVVADLRRSLSAVLEQTAIAIPLQERRYGVRVGPIIDRSILRAASFVLIVQADVPTETLRRIFPAQVKIGAVEQIRDLVNVAIPGIAVRPLPVAPRQIPFYAGALVFRARPQQPALAADAVLGRLRDPCLRRVPQPPARIVGDSRLARRAHERQSLSPSRTIANGR